MCETFLRVAPIADASAQRRDTPERKSTSQHASSSPAASSSSSSMSRRKQAKPQHLKSDEDPAIAGVVSEHGEWSVCSAEVWTRCFLSFALVSPPLSKMFSKLWFKKKKVGTSFLFYIYIFFLDSFVSIGVVVIELIYAINLMKL